MTFFAKLLILAALTANASSLAVAQESLQDNSFPQLSYGYPAAYTVRVCVGDKICPFKVQATFPCGTSEDGAAIRLCMIKKDGKDVVSPYRIAHQATINGPSCGYQLFFVTCLDQPVGPTPDPHP